jgi:hypothetical protein
MMSFSRASVELQPHGDGLLAHRAHLQVLCAVGARLHSQCMIGYQFIHEQADD